MYFHAPRNWYKVPAQKRTPVGKQIHTFGNVFSYLWTGYCDVELRSYAYGNIVPSERESYGYIKINNQTFLKGDMSEAYFLHPGVTNFRGINTMEFEFDTCSANNWKWFDTCSHRPKYYNNSIRCSGETVEFIEYFTTHVSNSTVLLGVTMDDPMLNMNQSFPMLMDAGIHVGEYPARSMFAFVTQKGAKDKTVLAKSGPQFHGITISVRISKTGKLIKVQYLLVP